MRIKPVPKASVLLSKAVSARLHPIMLGICNANRRRIQEAIQEVNFPMKFSGSSPTHPLSLVSKFPARLGFWGKLGWGRNVFEDSTASCILLVTTQAPSSVLIGIGACLHAPVCGLSALQAKF